MTIDLFGEIYFMIAVSALLVVFLKALYDITTTKPSE